MTGKIKLKKNQSSLHPSLLSLNKYCIDASITPAVGPAPQGGKTGHCPSVLFFAPSVGEVLCPGSSPPVLGRHFGLCASGPLRCSVLSLLKFSILFLQS